MLMSNLPPSWETYVTVVCNAYGMAINYYDAKSSILIEDTWRRSFVHDTVKDAFVVQSLVVRPNIPGRSSSRPLTNSQSRSKSKNRWTYNYYKKLAKNDKAQRADQNGGRQEEDNYVNSLAKVLTNNPNILFIENLVE